MNHMFRVLKVQKVSLGKKKKATNRILTRMGQTDVWELLMNFWFPKIFCWIRQNHDSNMQSPGLWLQIDQKRLRELIHLCSSKEAGVGLCSQMHVEKNP